MSEVIESKSQFEATPSGTARRWTVEMNAAKKNQEDWVRRGDAIVKRFIDDRQMTASSSADTRVNVFTANVQTMRAMLYGKTPKVDVGRRFTDPGDDVARVGAEMLQRLLNTDIERDDDTYAEALENALSDRLLSGLGVVRVRYEAEFNDVEKPAITRPDPVTGEVVELAPAYKETVKEYECVETDYVNWRDFRWSPSRTWNEVRWVAYKAPMTKEQFAERFGEDQAKLVPMTTRPVVGTSKGDSAEDEVNRNQPWSRVDVWEIWNKDDRKVYWWVEGYDRICDAKDDTLGLEGFWPSPRPMFANVTTSKLMPTPDFALAQDLYDEIDYVSTRITLLERAVAARGVYDATSEEVKRVLSEAIANELIPVNDFAIFKEKGGLQSVIDWLPIETFVNALQVLEAYRNNLLQLLYQVTGMSDIMRGQSTSGATATEQALKAKFASVRIQELQNEFARFASDCQSLKAEIISKHYDPETIIKCSNAQYMVQGDQQAAQQAIELIKSDVYQYRIEVKPESVAMADMAAIKQERSEFLMAISQFFQSSAPILQQAPWAAPYLIQILQWAMAGFRGGSTVESVLDQMAMAANQQMMQAQMQPPRPDPRMELEKMKMQFEMQKGQMDLMGQKAGLQMDAQKAALDLGVARQKAGIEMGKAQADAVASMRQEEAAAQADTRKLAVEERRAALQEQLATADHARRMQQSRNGKEDKR